MHTMIDAGANGVSGNSTIWIAMGFMKANRTVPPGCTLLVEPVWSWPLSLFNGYTHTYLFIIPKDPALKGLPLFAQACHHGFNGVAFSRGIQMSVR